MDQILKFLKKLSKKLSKKQRLILLNALRDIRVLNLKEYDVKKMKGLKGLYRVRLGKLRIVFRKEKEIGRVIDVNFRGGVYKNF